MQGILPRNCNPKGFQNRMRFIGFESIFEDPPNVGDNCMPAQCDVSTTLPKQRMSQFPPCPHLCTILAIGALKGSFLDDCRSSSTSASFSLIEIFEKVNEGVSKPPSYKCSAKLDLKIIIFRNKDLCWRRKRFHKL